MTATHPTHQRAPRKHTENVTPAQNVADPMLAALIRERYGKPIRGRNRLAKTREVA